MKNWNEFLAFDSDAINEEREVSNSIAKGRLRCEWTFGRRHRRRGRHPLHHAVSLGEAFLQENQWRCDSQFLPTYAPQRTHGRGCLDCARFTGRVQRVYGVLPLAR